MIKGLSSPVDVEYVNSICNESIHLERFLVVASLGAFNQTGCTNANIATGKFNDPNRTESGNSDETT